MTYYYVCNICTQRYMIDHEIDLRGLAFHVTKSHHKPELPLDKIIKTYYIKMKDNPQYNNNNKKRSRIIEKFIDLCSLMEAGFATSRRGRDYSLYYLRIYEWFYRNKSILLALNLVSIMLLFVIHLSILPFQINPVSFAEKVLQVINITLICIIALSLIWRGMVCIVIGILGLLLIYTGIFLPSYPIDVLDDSYLDSKNEKNNINIKQPISVAAHGFFFLGMSMVGLSMIIAYRPDVLYVRNRPKPLETIWESYPIWYNDNIKLLGRKSEPTVDIKTLMTDEEVYLLWRYDYILADVYGTPHLVRSDSQIPKSSTIFRDKKSGKMIGKGKYIGYFV
jgi:hypothetical protein